MLSRISLVAAVACFLQMGAAATGTDGIEDFQSPEVVLPQVGKAPDRVAATHRLPLWLGRSRVLLPPPGGGIPKNRWAEEIKRQVQDTAREQKITAEQIILVVRADEQVTVAELGDLLQAARGAGVRQFRFPATVTGRTKPSGEFVLDLRSPKAENDELPQRLDLLVVSTLADADGHATWAVGEDPVASLEKLTTALKRQIRQRQTNHPTDAIVLQASRSLRYADLLQTWSGCVQAVPPQSGDFTLRSFNADAKSELVAFSTRHGFAEELSSDSELSTETLNIK